MGRMNVLVEGKILLGDDKKLRLTGKDPSGHEYVISLMELQKDEGGKNSLFPTTRETVDKILETLIDKSLQAEKTRLSKLLKTLMKKGGNEKAIATTKERLDILENNYKNELQKRLDNFKKEKASYDISSANVLYDVQKKKYFGIASISPVETKNGIFYPFKPIELYKKENDALLTFPLTTSFSANILKKYDKETGELLTSKYKQEIEDGTLRMTSENQSDFYNGVLSVSDIKEGRYDALSVKILGKVNDLTTVEAIEDIFEKNQNFLKLKITTDAKKDFSPVFKENTNSPLVSFYLNDNEFYSAVGGQFNFVKEILKHGATIKNGDTNISIENIDLFEHDKEVISELSKALVKAFGGYQKALESKYFNEQTTQEQISKAKIIDEYKKLLDEVQNAKTPQEYLERINVLKERIILDKDKGFDFPVNISFPISNGVGLIETIGKKNYEKAIVNGNKKLLNSVASDIEKNLTDFVKFHYAYTATPEQKSRIEKDFHIDFDPDTKSVDLEARENINGKTIFDRMKLGHVSSQLNSQQKYYEKNGILKQVLYYSAVQRIGDRGEANISLTGVGRRKFKNDKEIDFLSRYAKYMTIPKTLIESKTPVVVNLGGESVTIKKDESGKVVTEKPIDKEKQKQIEELKSKKEEIEKQKIEAQNKKEEIEKQKIEAKQKADEKTKKLQDVNKKISETAKKIQEKVEIEQKPLETIKQESPSLFDEYETLQQTAKEIHETAVKTVQEKKEIEKVVQEKEKEIEKVVQEKEKEIEKVVDEIKEELPQEICVDVQEEGINIETTLENDLSTMIEQGGYFDDALFKEFVEEVNDLDKEQKDEIAKVSDVAKEVEDNIAPAPTNL